MKSASLRRKQPPALVPRLKEVAQVWLDVGCGGNKQPNCIGMDRRKLPGVDVVHDLEVVPWPLKADTFSRIVMSHVMEHVKPWLVIDVMNEMWRVMKVDGLLCMAMPYPGSHGHWQDPTHIKPWNETTPLYFCPGNELYEIYKPKPWKLEGCAWRNDGNIEFAMRKCKE